MNLDGRWEPLTTIAQALALVAVLWTWARHRKDPVAPAEPHTFREARVVTGPSRYCI